MSNKPSLVSQTYVVQRSSRDTLTKIIRRSKASHLHVLLNVRPALENRGDSLTQKRKGKKFKAVGKKVERERKDCV